jgi:hypothetical protein
LSILAEALAMRGVRQDDILAIAVWELPEKLKQIIVGGIAVPFAARHQDRGGFTAMSI